MKKYKYDSKRYLLSVTIPGFFMILILIYALFNNYHQVILKKLLLTANVYILPHL